MRFNLKLDDFSKVADEISDDGEAAVTAAMSDVTSGLKNELRQQVESAGLGARLAKTWQGKRFPEGRPSINAAAFVWSKAPKIVDAFDRGAVIRTINGRRYLAIPTENVPRRAYNRRMKPEEVENVFNQDLKFSRTRKGEIVAYVEAMRANNGRGFRRPSKGRFAQGRSAQTVIMFFLVPTVRLAKRLDIDGAANRWADRAGDLIVQHWS